MEFKAKRHPSGRPNRTHKYVGRRQPNLPLDGPLNPRLRRQNAFVHAVGFTANVCPDDYEDVYRGKTYKVY